MAFALHERLKADTVTITELEHCRVLLMNDSQYPWLILVPRYNDLRDLHDLSEDLFAPVMEEIRYVSEVLTKECDAFKINVAALGNMVPQLHIHIIARFEDDAAWPGPVWGVKEPRPYAIDDLKAIKSKLGTAIEGGCKSPE
ncbi:diadenosine tetraphosphate hydrolase [Kiloniella spongiae]|uniref:Diadenosine tetraphosphate hydrolase n=1 Tax=Kiloniella spongiae TaxID=1489064 RepID=A0A0H2MC44_9PROT|nr:HIT family protein [Kiloniella spongiae]KLN60109.1 diadenosine tetraphosphate hydrolase [Kiloniella spongiae]